MLQVSGLSVSVLITFKPWIHKSEKRKSKKVLLASLLETWKVNQPVLEKSAPVTNARTYRVNIQLWRHFEPIHQQFVMFEVKMNPKERHRNNQTQESSVSFRQQELKSVQQTNKSDKKQEPDDQVIRRAGNQANQASHQVGQVWRKFELLVDDLNKVFQQHADVFNET